MKFPRDSNLKFVARYIYNVLLIIMYTTELDQLHVYDVLLVKYNFRPIRESFNRHVLCQMVELSPSVWVVVFFISVGSMRRSTGCHKCFLFNTNTSSFQWIFFNTSLFPISQFIPAFAKMFDQLVPAYLMYKNKNNW